jgi:hypothetical protein
MKMSSDIVDPRPSYTFLEGKLPGKFQKSEGVSRIFKNIRTDGRVRSGTAGYNWPGYLRVGVPRGDPLF